MSVVKIVAKPEDADELARSLKVFLAAPGSEPVLVAWGTAEAMKQELKGGILVDVIPLLKGVGRALRNLGL